jgi:hypothetical protein
MKFVEYTSQLTVAMGGRGRGGGGTGPRLSRLGGPRLGWLRRLRGARRGWLRRLGWPRLRRLGRRRSRLLGENGALHQHRQRCGATKDGGTPLQTGPHRCGNNILQHGTPSQPCETAAGAFPAPDTVVNIGSAGATGAARHPTVAPLRATAPRRGTSGCSAANTA